MIRMVTNGADEAAFIHMASIGGGIYEGAGRLRATNHGTSAYYLDGWTLNLSLAPNAITGTLEPARGPLLVFPWSSATYTTNQGIVSSYGSDSDAYPTTHTRTGYGGISEHWSYNVFKQPTRYEDYLGNVTLYTYDARGNMLTKQVGIKNVAGVDTHQPEYAMYQWTYYPAGNPNQYLMSGAIDANGNRTDYVYDNNHRLTQLIEPPDNQGDPRATTAWSYDAAGRIQQVADPVSRTVQYFYDERDHVSKIVYGDSSTERFIYGAVGSGNENLLVKQKDRNGVVTKYDYDAAGRRTTTTVAYSTMDLLDNETLITDPSVQVTKTCTYLDGTDLVSSCTERGETTTYGYDFRQRLVSTTVQPRVGVSLTSTKTYLNNQLFCETDPYGQKKYYAYSTADGSLIRTIQGTVPSFALADFTAVVNQLRDQSPNAQCLITDYTLDKNGQQIALIDPRGNQHAQTFDSRGQLVQRVEASGTPVAATTAWLYDANGNEIEHRTPRYFDTTDPQVGNCRTTSIYTGRNLLKSQTEAPGTTVAATVQYTYNLDRTQATMIDARNNTWTTLWSPCCAGRTTSELDPTAAANTTEYDYAGNATHTQVIQGTTVYNATTTRYDARRRPILSTAWLTTSPAVDPNNPPIAGQNGVPAANGLTTQWYYDENVADDVGLSSVAGQNIPGIGNISIRPFLAEVQSDGVSFGGGSDGYAALEVKPDGELAVSVKDGAHRAIASGMIQLPSSPTPNQPITWQTVLNDTVATVSAPGNLLETASIDALNNTTRRRADGAGRVLQSVDAESNVTAFTFDANSNRLSVTDPNSVGYSAAFDARNRETSRTDTMNAVTSTGYDANSNIVRATDAKNNSSTAIFDARHRRISVTDRIGGTTSWGYDANSNLISLTDSESHATQFAFDPRNLKITETYADHNPPAVNDQVSFVYDGARRLLTRTDQLGDYVTMVYDMANRLTARQYRDHTKQPTDPPNDTDSFSYDAGGHMLTAASGRYSNTVTFTYDQAGRLASEALTIGGQTYTVGRGYDAANRLTSITYPDGSVAAQAFTARNLLQLVNYQSALAASFTYDAGGRRATRTLGDTPGTTTTWGYATGGDLTASISTPNLPSFTYAYDANKNKTAETITGVLAPYGFSTGASGYDNEDRLTNWIRADAAKSQSWALTNAGDWQQFVDTGVTHNRSHNATHELTVDNSALLTYDAKGSLTSDGTTGATFVWDFANLLQQTTVGGAITSFASDALGRRVSTSSGGSTTIYVPISILAGRNRLWQEIAVYAVGNPASTRIRNFVFGAGIDDPLVLDDMSATYHYHANAMGSVAFLTNGSATLAECYAYDAYGRPAIMASDGVTVLSASALSNPYLYSGRRFDSEAGLYYYRARYYDPRMGRFLSKDPVGFAASEANFYRYVRGNPIRFNDPSGLVPETPHDGNVTEGDGVFVVDDLGLVGWQLLDPRYKPGEGKNVVRFHWHLNWWCNPDHTPTAKVVKVDWTMVDGALGEVSLGIGPLGYKYVVETNIDQYTTPKPCPEPDCIGANLEVIVRFDVWLKQAIEIKAKKGGASGKWGSFEGWKRIGRTHERLLLECCCCQDHSLETYPFEDPDMEYDPYYGDLLGPKLRPAPPMDDPDDDFGVMPYDPVNE